VWWDRVNLPNRSLVQKPTRSWTTQRRQPMMAKTICAWASPRQEMELRWAISRKRSVQGHHVIGGACRPDLGWGWKRPRRIQRHLVEKENENGGFLKTPQRITFPIRSRGQPLPDMIDKVMRYERSRLYRATVEKTAGGPSSSKRPSGRRGNPGPQVGARVWPRGGSSTIGSWTKCWLRPRRPTSSPMPSSKSGHGRRSNRPSDGGL
jgi:hypothetical protein